MRHDYDYIPLSIIVFTDKKVVYANKYMKSIFLSDSGEFLTFKLLNMLNLNKEEDLYDFFIRNTSFEYKNNTIIIPHENKKAFYKV